MACRKRGGVKLDNDIVMDHYMDPFDHVCMRCGATPCNAMRCDAAQRDPTTRQINSYQKSKCTLSTLSFIFGFSILGFRFFSLLSSIRQSHFELSTVTPTLSRLNYSAYVAHVACMVVRPNTTFHRSSSDMKSQHSASPNRGSKASLGPGQHIRAQTRARGTISQ